MKDEVTKKIQVLMEKAKEGKATESNEKKKKESHIPNSLADHIKTEEEAKSFMTLLRAL